MPLTTAQVSVAHVSVTSSKAKVKLDSHTDKCVVGNNYFVTHEHNRSVHIYNYDPNHKHISAKTVNATVGYQDTLSGQQYILMINQAIQING